MEIDISFDNVKTNLTAPRALTTYYPCGAVYTHIRAILDKTPRLWFSGVGGAGAANGRPFPPRTLGVSMYSSSAFSSSFSRRVAIERAALYTAISEGPSDAQIMAFDRETATVSETKVYNIQLLRLDQQPQPSWDF